MSSLFKPLLIQSFRAGGIYLLIIALSLAISVTTALKLSNEQIQNAVTQQAAEMLAGDLVLSDKEPIADIWKQQATAQHFQQSNVTVFSSMARTHDQFVMVNVKAIDTNFPLRGRLQIEPETQQIKSGEIWLSPRAMDLLKAKLGDSVFLADGEFKVAGVIVHDSNQELGFSGLSPAVMINQMDVAKTHAIQVGSRIEYRLLLSGTAEQIQMFEQNFKQRHDVSDHSEDDLDASLRLQNAAQSNTRLMKAFENLDTFLQLSSILTILLCGVAIALTSQRYVQQNQDYIALIRCLGATKWQIVWAYFGLLCVVYFISIFIGSLLSMVLGYALLQLMLQLIPQLHLSFSLIPFLFGPLAVAVFTSMVVMAGFILPSIWGLFDAPPIQVIRQGKRSRRSFAFIFLAGSLSLAFFSIVLSENIRLSGMILAAILLLSVILYSMVWSLLKFIKQLKNQLSVYIRTVAQTSLQITALALGLSLITVLIVLRTDLLQRWQQQLPEGTPNQFVYGLPPFDMPEFKRHLEQNGWPSTALYPNVRGRLVAKNNQPFSTQLIQQNNALRRELNLTQAATLPQDNLITQGQPAFNQVNQVSVEAKLAKELAIKVGDTLTFSLPDGVLSARVVNLRSVEWESFSPNFFFIFSPHSMSENAGSYLGSFYVPPQDRHKLIQMIQWFSNTVFIDVSLILGEIKQLLEVLAQVISVLAILVGGAGILVLIACLNLLMDERRREVALMRSLGLSKHKLKQMLSLEIGFIGCIAGVVSCFFAEMISAIASYKMKIELQWHPEIWLILPIVMMLICTLIGRYRLGYLCDIPPLQSLREINSS